jgi:cellulose synthase/poly-beta-1,6-N-acetylglucosamine synthase-like glycosyltransferase
MGRRPVAESAVGQFTNDTKRLNLHSIVAILVIGSIGIAYAVCLTVVFIAMEWAPECSRAVPAAAALTGMFFCSLLIWFCYKLLYNRGRLDTMRVADS